MSWSCWVPDFLLPLSTPTPFAFSSAKWNQCWPGTIQILETFIHDFGSFSVLNITPEWLGRAIHLMLTTEQAHHSVPVSAASGGGFSNYLNISTAKRKRRKKLRTSIVSEQSSNLDFFFFFFSKVTVFNVTPSPNLDLKHFTRKFSEHWNVFFRT